MTAHPSLHDDINLDLSILGFKLPLMLFGLPHKDRGCAQIMEDYPA